MRIDQNLPISDTTIQSERVSGTKTGQANSTSQSSSTTGTSSSSASSSSGVSVFTQQMQATLAATPDIRQDKVAKLQAAMQNGTYNVSSQDIANSMFNTMVQKTIQ
jgi:negative regulator of flagellin synthesis FlgM